MNERGALTSRSCYKLSSGWSCILNPQLPIDRRVASASARLPMISKRRARANKFAHGTLMRPVFQNICIKLLVVAVGVAGPAIVVAADTSTIEVKTVDREAEIGTLESFSLETGLRWKDSAGATKTIPAEDVVNIQAGAETTSPAADQVTLFLVGGYVLHGRIAGGTEETVRIEPTGLRPIDVPLVELIGLRTAAGRARLAHGQRERMTAGKSDDDILVLANGDRVTGGVVRIDAKGVVIETAAGESRVTLDRLLEARLAALVDDERSGRKARLFLADGSVLEASTLHWTPDRLAVRLFDDAEQEIKPDQVVRIEVVGGRWQWLSELEPAAAEHTPYLTLTWPWQRDRNVLGKPMRLGGKRFDRGIGVHSQSRLVYAIQGKYRIFTSRFGLDDSAGVLGDVDIEVRVDGQVRFRKEHIRVSSQGAPPQSLRIDVSGARQLELLVTFGQRGDVQDRFNWAGAALIR